MNDVVIVAATRTAIGSFQGALASVPAVDLGAAVIKRLLEQTGLDPAQVDEVILGQVLTLIHLKRICYEERSIIVVFSTI